MTGSLVLGIDGGGTKTRAAAIQSRGEFGAAAAGVAGPSNIAAVGADAAARAVEDAIARALDQLAASAGAVAAICAAVAGYSHVEARAQFAARLRERFPDALLEVAPDYAAAFTGALAGGCGVVVIAGTGQISYGENESGHSARCGGYGYLIDDAGSGYGVGREALAAVLRAGDGSGPATALSDVVYRRLAVDGPEQIIAGVYGGAIDRLAIASLAAGIMAAAEEGDEVASAIAHRSARSLAQLASSVGGRLFSTETKYHVATIGSLWNSQLLASQFAAYLAKRSPDASIAAAAFDPAVGAALRARRLLDRRPEGTVN